MKIMSADGRLCGVYRTLRPSGSTGVSLGCVVNPEWSARSGSVAEVVGGPLRILRSLLNYYHGIKRVNEQNREATASRSPTIVYPESVMSDAMSTSTDVNGQTTYLVIVYLHGESSISITRSQGVQQSFKASAKS